MRLAAEREFKKFKKSGEDPQRGRRPLVMDSLGKYFFAL